MYQEARDNWQKGQGYHTIDNTNFLQACLSIAAQSFYRFSSGFDSLRLHQMDITRTPTISKAVSPYWCGCDVNNRNRGSRFCTLTRGFIYPL